MEHHPPPYHHSANGDAAVGDVEYRPDAKVHKVNDCSVHDPIPKVSNGAAHDQRKAVLAQPMHGNPVVEPRDCANNSNPDEKRNPGKSFEHAKANPGVRDKGQVQKRK